MPPITVQSNEAKSEVYTTASDFFFVEDTNLAAALVALGYEPYQRRPVAKVIQNGTPLPAKLCFERDKAAERLSAIWQDKETWHKFEFENPEHPLCYIRAQVTMRQRYLDAIKRSAELVIVKSKRLPGAWEFRTRMPVEVV